MTTNWANSGGPSTTWTNSTGPNTGYNVINPPNTLFGDTLVWDVNSVSGATISTDRLTVRNASTGVGVVGGIQGVVASAQSSGKFYFEITCTSVVPTGGYVISIAPNLTAYSDILNEFQNSTPTGITVSPNGAISSYGNATGINISPVINQQFAGVNTGDTVGIALDLDNKVVYFKIVAGPDAGSFATYLDWNGHGGSHTADPGTGVGGIALGGSSSTQFIPFVCFGDDISVAENTLTANFGSVVSPPFACLSTNPDYFTETLTAYNTWPFL